MSHRSFATVARVAITGMAIGLIAASATAAVLTVCDSGCDHTTIQAAATAADPGDTIQILSLSAHTEGEIFLVKDLIIDGFGASTTIIQADPTAGSATVPVFVIQAGAAVTMLDLTIRHGVGSQGGGVSVLDGNLTLQDVVVSANQALEGGGIYVGASGSLETLRTELNWNEAFVGGGLYASGPVEMTDSSVVGNAISGPRPLGAGVAAYSTLTLLGCDLSANTLTVAAGSTQGGEGCGLRYVGSNLVAENTVFSSNTGTGFSEVEGGGAFLGGSGIAAFRSCTFDSNTADLGGGVYSLINDLSIEDSTVSANTASSGGGLLVLGDPTTSARIHHSTINDNLAIDAAGLAVSGSVSVVNSTISGNNADNDAGGILATSDGLDIASTTIANNTADADGDGFGNVGGILIQNGVQAELRNTIVAGNLDLSPLPSPIVTDCSGTIDSAGYNLVQFLGSPLTVCEIVGDLTGNLIGIDPNLVALGDNGGPTRTHSLDRNSPAVDAANPAGCVDPNGVPLPTDQRHGVRQDRCDIGSFERGALLDLVFADGFESGDTSNWSGVVD